MKLLLVTKIKQRKDTIISLKLNNRKRHGRSNSCAVSMVVWDNDYNYKH